MTDLKAYLASKSVVPSLALRAPLTLRRYMTGPKADAILARSSDPSLKKRKKRPRNEDYPAESSHAEGSGGAGLMLKDEDAWQGEADEVDLEGADAPGGSVVCCGTTLTSAVVGKALATFKRSSNAWSTVGSTSMALPPSEIKAEPEPDAEDASAPAAPSAQLTRRRGGLRTAAQMAQEAAKIQAERSPSPEPGEGEGPDPTVTVHRDASGRVVDVEKLKAEARERERDEQRKKKEREEWGKGMVQRQQKDEQRRQEREMGEKDMSRYADDVKMNKEMQEVERWNDPAAEFLTVSHSRSAGFALRLTLVQKKKKKGPRRPQYQGSFPPNRFGIRPGYRWDGVDRSNGFEHKFFQYQNAAARKTLDSHNYAVADM